VAATARETTQRDDAQASYRPHSPFQPWSGCSAPAPGGCADASAGVQIVPFRTHTTHWTTGVGRMGSYGRCQVLPRVARGERTIEVWAAKSATGAAGVHRQPPGHVA